MINKSSNNKSFDEKDNLDNDIKELFEYDLLQIPEDSIYIEDGEYLNYSDLVFEALKISISERGLEKSFKVRKIDNISKNMLTINNFYTQLVYAEPFDEEVIIPINPWLKKGKAPQIILAAQIDEENSMVNFIGILTSKEFKFLLSKKIKKPATIILPLSSFNGDIDLLFSYTKSFNNRVLLRDGFSEKLQLQKNNEYFKKEPILLIFSLLTIFTSLILGERLLTPKIVSNNNKVIEESKKDLKVEPKTDVIKIVKNGVEEESKSDLKAEPKREAIKIVKNGVEEESKKEVKIWERKINPKIAFNYKCRNYEFKDFTIKFLNEINESKFININSLGCSQIKKIDNLESSKIFITTGRRNKKSVSCLTDNKSEPCKFVLGEFYINIISPRIALKTIFDYEEKQEGFLNETNSRLFINIYDALTKKYR